MNAKQRYKDYSKETQNYMQKIIDGLGDQNNEIPESWEVSIDMMADNYEVYYRAKTAVLTEGLIRKDNQNRTFKNQSYPLMINSQQNLVKLLMQFGLTPVSKTKIKKNNNNAKALADLMKA